MAEGARRVERMQVANRGIAPPPVFPDNPILNAAKEKMNVDVSHVIRRREDGRFLDGVLTG